MKYAEMTYEKIACDCVKRRPTVVLHVRPMEIENLFCQECTHACTHKPTCDRYLLSPFTAYLHAVTSNNRPVRG